MITVFTPTYNRAYKLPQLYDSLKRQTEKGFEWLIVDDGSTDDTEQMVRTWQIAEKEFSIKYVKKKNGGKHTAINIGVNKASFDWFFIVDSDDYVTDDAIEKIISWISSGVDSKFAAVSGLRMSPDGKIIGGNTKILGEYIDCKNTDREKYGLGGDKAEVYRTSVLRKYPFKVFQDEKFLSEDSVWAKLSHDGYVTRWFNAPIIVCEYLEDGLTAKVKNEDLELNNFKGYTYWTNVRIEAYSGLERIRIICQYINKANKKKMSTVEIALALGLNVYLVKMLALVVRTKNFFNKKEELIL